MYTVGSRGLYQWLVTDDEQFDLLEACPEIVFGRYVAITSIDSSEFVLTEDERASGWQNRGRIAYSPKVQTIDALPRDGWDEWYIFDKYSTSRRTWGQAIFKRTSLRSLGGQDTCLCL